MPQKPRLPADERLGRTDDGDAWSADADDRHPDNHGESIAMIRLTLFSIPRTQWTTDRITPRNGTHR